MPLQVLGLPFIAALTMLLLKVDLQVTSVSVIHVAIPFFAVHSLACCACLGLCSFNFLRWMRRRSTMDREEALVVAIVMVVVLVFFASTLMLALRFQSPDDSRLTAASALVPVELLIGVLSIGGILLALVLLRKARRHEFKGLYGPASVVCIRCCCCCHQQLLARTQRFRRFVAANTRPFRRPALVELDSQHASSALI